ncbi:unnamed protein product, partial [Dicrocoelium dendriticum]
CRILHDLCSTPPSANHRVWTTPSATIAPLPIYLRHCHRNYHPPSIFATTTATITSIIVVTTTATITSIIFVTTTATITSIISALTTATITPIILALIMSNVLIIPHTHISRIRPSSGLCLTNRIDFTCPI